MGRGLSIALLVVSFLSCTSCTTNIMQSFGDETSNEAIFTAASKDLNTGSYDAALTKIADLTPEYAAQDKVVLLKASAYAGKCGLNFVDLIKGFENIGTKNFMILLMNLFRAGTTAKAGFCLQAEDLVETLGNTPATRTQDENLFLALISFARLGTWLSYYADANNDLAVDNVDFCTAGTTVPDADIRKMGSAINIGLHSLIASGVSLGGTSFDTTILAACAALGPQDFCSTYEPNPAAFTPQQISGIRIMIHEGPATNAIGIFSCVQPADASCGAPTCP